MPFTDVILIAGAIILQGSLVFFVPLWGPGVVFGKPQAPEVTGPALPAFFASDFLVLSCFLSVANALVALLRQETDLFLLFPRGSEVLWLALLACAANGLVLLIWIRGLRFMRQRGIQRQRQRLWFQALLHPLAILGPTCVLMSGLMIVSAFEVMDPRWTVVSIACGLISLLITFGTRRLYQRICLAGLALHKSTIDNRHSTIGSDFGDAN